MSPSPTPSPTPTASATPFISSADEAGAHAFVLAYFVEIDRAYATGDVSRLKPYRVDTCSCLRAETYITTAYARRERFVGVHFEVLKWAWGAHGPAFARTAIAFHLAPVRHVYPGKPTAVETAVDGYYAIDLRRTGDRWQISGIRFKQAEPK